MREVEPKKLGFSARFDAQAREYHYHLCVDSTCPIFMKDFSWFVPGGLDITAMEAGAQYLLGEHDFKSFCGNKKMKKSTVRTISDITFEKEGTKLLIRYTGNGFLYHMVRILTGTLIEIGLGERSPQEMKEILLKLDRQAAGFTAPPEGLFLERVMYEDRE